MQLTDRALLVQLTISTWTARKHDKKATRDTTAANNAADTAGRFNKHLLPQSDALKNVQQKAGQIRAYFYENTLPWGIDGVQLLPSKNYLNFVTEMRKLKNEFNYLVQMFLLGYPGQVKAAQQFLGAMYDPADYPDEDAIASKFNIDMAAFPVPTDDFRVDIDDDEMAQIQEDVRRRVIESQKRAMQDVWQRLYNRLQVTYEKLVQPDAVFRDSLIENIHELCDLLPRLNVDDDPNLETMRQEVLSKVAAFSPDALRSDKQVRADTASATKAIMDTMSALYMNE